MADERLPWERRPGESGAAYETFLLFRDLGPERTMTEATRLRYGGKDCRTNLYEWREKHGWDERIAAWDRHVRAITDAAIEEETRAKATALEEERIAAARERLVTARSGVRLVLKWIAAQKDPSAVPAGSIPPLLKVCADLARLEDGEVTERTAQVVNIDPATIKSLGDWLALHG